MVRVDAFCCAVALATGLAMPTLAAAQETPSPTSSVAGRSSNAFKPGMRVALELGSALPFGGATTSRDLDELIAPPVVFGFDAAWQPVRSFDVGLTSLFGIGTARGPRCPEPSTACTLSIEVLGFLRARYHLPSLHDFESWVGLGAGIDFLTNQGQGGAASQYYFYSVTEYYVGPVLGAVHAGFGYRLTPLLSIGVVVDFALARYMTVKRQVRAAENPPYHSHVGPNDELLHSAPQRRIDGPLHEWLLLRAHVTFEMPR